MVLFGLAIIFAVGLGAVVSTAFFAKHEIDKLLTPKSADVRKAQTQLAAPLPGKPANILVLGSDHRTGADAGDRRSDTLMMVRLDPRGKTISMLSFPRDLYVPIPGHGSSKINDAYSYGGSALTVQTVKQLTGLDVNFIINVDFRGFRGIVDTIGGVYVDVDRRYLNDQSAGGGNYAEIDLKPGYQLLYGRDALAYARYRHTDSDFHRIARQQLIMAQMRKQIGASEIAKNFSGLFQVLYKNTDMAAGGRGKISTRTMIDYIRLALSLDANDIYQFEVQGGIGTGPGGASIVEADEATIQAQVDAFLRPDGAAQEKTADQVTGEKADQPATADTGEKAPVLPPPGRVSIEVRNGNGISGSAGTAAGQLRGLGYPVTVQSGTAANADNQNYANTRVQFRADRDRALAEAIAKQFEGATAEPATPANAFTSRLLIIVGRQGSVITGASPVGQPGGSGTATAEGNRVPEKAEAKVVKDPLYGVDDFRQVRGKVGFPVLYPTVRESSSTFDDDGVWVYQIAQGRKRYGAYRMVAQTGASDYWGFQGTSWTKAPILDSPTRTLKRGGRTYLLFFNGTRLHMVGWREGKAAYWVSNSVLDKLSNETMLAIAQGVTRVPRR